MAKIKVKSRNRYDLRLSLPELNTLTIALAQLDILTMEDELKEQGLDFDKAEYDHLSLFEAFTDINGMYPQKELPDDLNSVIPISPLLEVDQT